MNLIGRHCWRFLFIIIFWFFQQNSRNYCLALDNSGYIVSTYAGNGVASSNNDGSRATSASISGPFGIWQDSAGNLYVTDGDNCIRKIDESSGIISTFLGTSSNSYNGDGLPATSTQINGAGGRFDLHYCCVYSFLSVLQVALFRPFFNSLTFRHMDQ